MPRFILLEFFRSFFIISTQTIYVSPKLYSLSCFATLRAIFKFFSIFQYTLQLDIKISECFNIYRSLTDLSFTKIQMLNSNQGGMRAKFECLKVIFSSSGESLLGVLLLLKISRNLVESTSFKTSCQFRFFQIRINFLKKSSNCN